MDHAHGLHEWVRTDYTVYVQYYQVSCVVQVHIFFTCCVVGVVAS